MFKISDFGSRHGLQEERRVFKDRDNLPEDIRRDAGRLMFGHFVAGFQTQKTVGGHRAAFKTACVRFSRVVRDQISASPEMWEWYKRTPAHVESRGVTFNAVRARLVRPLEKCDWREFYSVVEDIYAELRIGGAARSGDFSADLNHLFECRDVPWVLQSGWVIPAADSEFADELEYVGQESAEDDDSDPRVSLKKAYAALFRKQGGPDITSACLHSWSAWETARESAGGVEHVRISYPELWESVTAWQKLIHAGRHPGKKLGRLPTEMDAGFIVRLLTNAVRLVFESAATKVNS